MSKKIILMGGYYYWANAVQLVPGSEVFGTSLFTTEVVPLPIDGEVVGLEDNSQADITLLPNSMYGPAEIPFSTFDTLIERLNTRRSLGWGQQNSNWLALGQSTTTIDWADPIAIAPTIANFGLAARIAKEGKLAGIQYDAEPYANCGIWNYPLMPQAGTYTFEEYKRFTYQGAVAIGKLWKGYFPGIKIMLTKDYATSIDQQDASGSNGNYVLYEAFLDGIYDGLGAPPEVCPPMCCSREEIIMTDNSGWAYSDEATMESEVLKLKGVSDRRYKGSSPYYAHLTKYGYGLWPDLPGAGGGFPPFDNVDPNLSQVTPDDFYTQMEYYLRATDYLWIFNQYYNFHNSPQIISAQYNNRMQTIRTVFGMVGG